MLRVAAVWLVMMLPGMCASFSGVVVTDGGTPVSGARLSWQNQGVCMSRPAHGPTCDAPTVSGSGATAADGSFAVSSLPAGVYNVCVSPVAANQLKTCDWFGFGDSGPYSVALTVDQDVGDLKYILRTGTLIVIHVNDPEGLILKFHTGVGIFYGTGAYTGASYSADRKAYTLVVPKGLKATLFIDTLLLLNDAMGNSLPVDAGVMPFQAAGEEIDLSFSVTAALVNAASYLPGIDEGAIVTLFGSGFTDVPGVHAANTLPLPILIAGTSVKVNGIAAPLLAVIDEDGKSQINFQVPHSPGYIGSSFVIVVENHGKAQTFYTRQWGQLGVFPTLAHETGDAITAGNAALPGEQVFVYWTGVNGFDFFDTVTGSIIPDGQPSPATAVCAQYFSPQVKVGGIAADVSSCAAAPGLVGIGQLVFTVPMGLSAGGHDVVVDLASIRGNTVELPVAIP